MGLTVSFSGVKNRLSSFWNHDLFRLLSGTFLLLSAYFVVCILFLSVDAWDSAKALLMQYFGLLLPGAALNLILWKKKQTQIEFIIISYDLGYITTLICYFLFIPWGGQVFAPFATGLCGVLALSGLWKNRCKIQLEFITKSDLPFFIIFIIYMVFLFFSYAANLMTPDRLGEASYMTDHLYWIENAGALMRRFPPLEPRVNLQTVYSYHYFSSIHLAWTSLSSGISLFSLGGTLYSLTSGILMFGGVYLVAIKFCRSMWLRVTAVCAMLFCTGFEAFSHVMYISHLYIAPFGFDIALAFAGIFIYLFSHQCDLPRFDKRLFLLTMSCFAACVGLKGPVGALMLVAGGVPCAFWLFKKNVKPALIYGISLLSIFLIITIGTQGVLNEGSSGAGYFSLTEFLDHSDTLLSLDAGIGNDAWWPAFMKYAVFGGLVTVFTHPLIIAFFVAGLISMLIIGKMRTPLTFGLALSGLAGLVLGIFNRQPGNSQMYFSMAALLPCLCLGLKCLNHFRTDSVAVKRFLVATCGVFIFLQSMLSLCTAKVHWGPGLASGLRTGWLTMTSSRVYAEKNTIQQSDYMAMCWIQKNTPRNSVVMTDRSVAGDIDYYMYYGAFSERQMYLEGDIYFREKFVSEREEMRQLVREVYGGSSDALRQAKNEGVDYIVQTIWITPDFAPDETLAELVLGSESVRVYRII